MGRIAVTLGSGAFGPRGRELAAVAEASGAVVLQRHGTESYTLPHAIDHDANLRRLLEAGCDRVLAFGSVGSLSAELGVGSFVCPDDFVALQVTLTTFTDPRAHAMPGFDSAWRAELVSAWRKSGAGELGDGGVYWQTNGPRFETPAEIRVIAAHADLVGMTLASECIVAGELGLRYAAICVVDNLANGIAPVPFSVEELEEAREVNADRLRAGLEAVLPELAG
jgi:5'-methylthioadenosine phosphorylase